MPRLYKYVRDMWTLMTLTHTFWLLIRFFSLMLQEKHEGWKCCSMMYRCNIEWVLSRGGEMKATSSPGRLFLRLPSRFTPCNYQLDGRYRSNTQGHPNVLTKHTRGFKSTQMYLCTYTRTLSEMNPGWSQAQHCFHLRRLWV